MQSSRLALLMIAACGAHHAAPTSSSPSNPPPLAQGVRGQVTILTGDFMPPGQGQTAPAAGTRVHVFAGRHPVVAQLAADDPSLRGTATTDADGEFLLALPPGTYTVVAERDGALYLNCFAGDGGWCTTEVAAGAWAHVAIADSSHATF